MKQKKNKRKYTEKEKEQFKNNKMTEDDYIKRYFTRVRTMVNTMQYQEANIKLKYTLKEFTIWWHENKNAMVRIARKEGMPEVVRKDKTKDFTIDNIKWEKESCIYEIYRK